MGQWVSRMVPFFVNLGLVVTFLSMEVEVPIKKLPQTLKEQWNTNCCDWRIDDKAHANSNSPMHSVLLTGTSTAQCPTMQNALAKLCPIQHVVKDVVDLVVMQWVWNGFIAKSHTISPCWKMKHGISTLPLRGEINSWWLHKNDCVHDCITLLDLTCCILPASADTSANLCNTKYWLHFKILYK